jgi:hypothetical protein
MQLDRIVINPAQNKLVIQYLDDNKRPLNLTLDTTGNSTVTALVADAQQRMPKPQDRPDKLQIQKQISQLEGRIRILKESIGAT